MKTNPDPVAHLRAAADAILAIPEIRNALEGKRSYGVNASLDTYVLGDPSEGGRSDD